MRRIGGTSIPELPSEEWALVLWTMPPASLVDFAMNGDANGLLGPPVIGRFGHEINPEIGLAATVAAWLEGQHAVVLAPPLLSDGDGPYRLAALRRAWPLPAAELLSADGGRAATMGPAHLE